MKRKTLNTVFPYFWSFFSTANNLNSRQLKPFSISLEGSSYQEPTVITLNTIQKGLYSYVCTQLHVGHMRIRNASPKAALELDNGKKRVSFPRNLPKLY